jgi:uncharacterized protein YacL
MKTEKLAKIFIKFTDVCGITVTPALALVLTWKIAASLETAELTDYLIAIIFILMSISNALTYVQEKVKKK